jgi:hypothetical protein
MITDMLFCVHLDSNSINIYGGKKCFEKTSYRTAKGGPGLRRSDWGGRPRAFTKQKQNP